MVDCAVLGEWSVQLVDKVVYAREEEEGSAEGGLGRVMEDGYMWVRFVSQLRRNGRPHPCGWRTGNSWNSGAAANQRRRDDGPP